MPGKKEGYNMRCFKCDSDLRMLKSGVIKCTNRDCKFAWLKSKKVAVLLCPECDRPLRLYGKGQYIQCVSCDIRWNRPKPKKKVEEIEINPGFSAYFD